MKLVCQNFRTIFVRNGPFWVGPRIAKRKPTVIHAMIEFSCFRGLKDCIYFMTFAHHIVHTLKSLRSEVIPSATQYFKRAYKISHFPGL